MKRFIRCTAAVFALSIVATGSDAVTMTGWVNDAKCAAAGMKPKASCVKACNEGGQKLVFVDDKEQKVLQVANQDSLKDHPGEHVQVTATKTADGSLQISDVKALPGETHEKKQK